MKQFLSVAAIFMIAFVTAVPAEEAKSVTETIVQEVVAVAEQPVAEAGKDLSESVGNAIESVGNAIESTAEAAKPLTGTIAEKAAASLDKIFEYVEVTEDFVIEQTPLVVREIWHWGIASHVIYWVIWTAIGILCIFVDRKCFREAKVYEEQYEKTHAKDDCETASFLWAMGIAFRLSGIVTILVSACANGLIIAKIYFAPRLYLLEILPELVKGIGS